IRFVVAGSILLIPTFMMGATLPALAEYFARRDGRRIAPEWLYTLNLLGAVAGTALAGFALMPAFGVWGTIATGATLNLGGAARVLPLPASAPRADGERDEEIAERAASRGRRDDEDDEEAPEPLSPLLIASAFASGLLSLATQVAWNRVLVLVVGSTTYAF